jgi:predicted MFS family arabinose efflux permease
MSIQRLTQQNSWPATLAAILVGVLAFGGLQSGVVPIIETVEHDLHASTDFSAWLVTIYLIVATAATPALGRMADLYGRRRVLVIGLVVFAAGSVMAAAAPNIMVLLFARGIQGVGGAVYPLALALGRERAPQGSADRSVAILSMGFGIGTAVGFVAGGVLAGLASWRWLFVGGAVLTLCAAVLVRWQVGDQPAGAGGGFDGWGTAAFSIAGGALLTALTLGSSSGWRNPFVIGLFVLAVLSGICWAWLETKIAHPLIDLQIMRSRPVATVNLAALGLGWGLFSTYLLLPRVLQERSSTGYGLGLEPQYVGLLLLPIAVGQAISSMLAGRWSKPGSVQWVLGVALGLMTIALGTFSAVQPQVGIVAAAGLVLGFGMGAGIEACSAVSAAGVRADVTAASTALNSTARRLGGGIGGQVSTVILGLFMLSASVPSFTAFRYGFGIAAVLCLLAAIFGWLGTRMAPD